MKTLALAVGLVSLLTCSAGCGSSKGDEKKIQEEANPYVGTWQGKDQLGQTMTITLESNGQLKLRIQGRRREFVSKGTWKIDTTKSPAHLEIDMRNRMPIRTICKLDKNRFVFENINSSDRRPSRFGRRRIIMSRIK